MIESVTGALAALRGSIGLVKTAVDVRDDRKLSEALTGINDRIIAVQDACMRLQETNNTLLQDKHALAQEKRQLEKQIAELEQRAAKLAGYELTHTPAGSTVYMEKGAAPGSQTAKYVCATCAECGDITYLQPESNWYFLTCTTHGRLHFRNLESGTTVMSTGRGHDPYEGF